MSSLVRYILLLSTPVIQITFCELSGEKVVTEEKKTMFEELDEKLTRMLESPKPDECKKVLKLIKLYQTTMFRIQKRVENNDMEMVEATQKVYDSGGPRFLQIRINDHNFKKLGWSEEDLDQYYNLRLLTDQAWFELRQILFSK
ncbi:hypothetical protein J6590_066889 [Homalodisca vitripennis]|nr:hypothetical protein J6590_066889 [Homalodisca vitripennis]